MSRHIRALRFGFRLLENRTGQAGIVLTPRGSVELVSDGDTVRQAILLLVSTRPGERVMRPEYGCHIFRLAFAPNDDTTAGLAIHYVKSALERWETRIEVLKLDAQRSEEHKSRLDMHLQYRLRRLSGVEQVKLSYDLHSGRVA
jgi:uncharacterized protein